MTATCNISLDFDTNEQIKTDVLKARKNGSTETKETRLGKMVENQYRLEKALSKKQMTFDELITFLNKRDVKTKSHRD